MQAFGEDNVRESPAHSSPASKPDESVSSASATVVTSDKNSPATSTATTHHTSVLQQPDHGLVHRMPHRLPMPAYGLTNGTPVGMHYLDPMHMGRPQLPHGYPPQAPLPPMYLPGASYSRFAPPPNQVMSSHSQVMRGVFSRPPTETSHSKPVVQVTVVKKNNSSNGDAETTVSKSQTPPGGGELAPEGKQTAEATAKSPERTVTKSQTTSSVQIAHSSCLNGNAYPHNMMTPGFLHSPPGGMAMRMPGELIPTHQMSQPVHMMRTADGQVFYRYANPRMPLHPQMYPHGYNPVGQRPYLSPHPLHTEHESAASISPKRKRRKASAKVVIESHSAILAGTEDKPENLTTNPDRPEHSEAS